MLKKSLLNKVSPTASNIKVYKAGLGQKLKFTYFREKNSSLEKVFQKVGGGDGFCHEVRMISCK